MYLSGFFNLARFLRDGQSGLRRFTDQNRLKNIDP